MAGIDLATAQAHLDAYLSAELALIGGAQSYTLSVGGSSRQVTRADLDGIQAGVKLWDGRVQRLARSGRMAVLEVIPR